MKNKRILESSDGEEDELLEGIREDYCKIAPPSIHRDYGHDNIDPKEKSEKAKRKKQNKSNGKSNT